MSISVTSPFFYSDINNISHVKSSCYSDRKLLLKKFNFELIFQIHKSLNHKIQL
jgi:hypothetical protein